MKSHEEVTEITVSYEKEAETVSREHLKSLCARVRFGETITHIRFGDEPCRTGGGAAFGLCDTHFATGRMRDSKNAVPMRPDEHGRERRSARLKVGYVLLLYL